LKKKTYILDDGTAENAWRINPDAAAWMGNEFVVTDESGEITSVDVYGDESGTGRTVSVDIFDASKNLVGSTAPFLLPEDDWINVPLLSNVPYSGKFYAMVKWSAEPGNSTYLGVDEDGPNVNKNLDWYITGTGTWYPGYEAFGYYWAPQVFMIRVNAQLSGKSVSYALDNSSDDKKTGGKTNFAGRHSNKRCFTCRFHESG